MTIPRHRCHLASVAFLLGMALNSFAGGPYAAQMTNTILANGQVAISWSSRGALEMADQITGPWTSMPNPPNPWTNTIQTNAQFFRLNQMVDATTLHKKVLCGYQGWFRAGSAWDHWSRNWAAPPTTNDLTSLIFDMWPDMSEYTNQYPVPGFDYPGGATASLYNGSDQQTVDTHFNWMQEYGIDGVVLQRFVVSITASPDLTNVLNYARAAANRTGRTFCLEYDMSGATNTTLFYLLTNDWTWLVNSQQVTKDPRYLYQDGKPVLFLYGFYPDRFTNDAPALPGQIVSWFETNSTQSVTLIGSGEWWWNTETAPGWSNLFRSLNGYVPWNTGNYSTVVDGTTTNKYATVNYWASDLQAATNAGMIYLPELYPGFSWDNLQELPPGTSKIDRLGGNFLWQQFYAVKKLGLDWAFVGMFDEVSEGTAIYKVSNTPPTPGYFVTYDGYPTDWYLRLTAAGSKVLSGEAPNSATIPIAP